MLYFVQISKYMSAHRHLTCLGRNTFSPLHTRDSPYLPRPRSVFFFYYRKE